MRCAAIFQQLERVAHIGRGEQVHVLTLLDALTHQAGRAEIGDDGRARRLFVAFVDFGHYLA
jgi:hypothetical protein